MKGNSDRAGNRAPAYRDLDVFGEPRVNVMTLNFALDPLK
jgi:K+-transporting ATPase c subunit